MCFIHVLHVLHGRIVGLLGLVCLIKQVYTIKNRMFLLIWARLEPPTEVQIFLNCPKWSHTPSFMYWQEDQL